MARYTVVVMRLLTLDIGPEEEEEVGEQHAPECEEVIQCETTQDVARAIRMHGETPGRQHPEWTWAVFETVGGRSVRRSVTPIYDCVLS